MCLHKCFIVFQRPRDISKTFGGGRTITREEMKAMDEEFERRELEQRTAVKIYASDTMKYEAENMDRIKDALNRWYGIYILRSPKYTQTIW